MSKSFAEVSNEEFKAGVEDTLYNYKIGKRVKGTVIRSDENGVHIAVGGKLDGFIPAEEAELDEQYSAANFPEGREIEAVILSKRDADSNCVLLSKKEADNIRKGDLIVDTIRNGEFFELSADSETKGGLLGKLGNYVVFIPASQIRESFIKDLKPYVGKKLRLVALEIDDKKRRIVASARKIIEQERIEREEIFWTHVQPNIIVNGKVKRIADFGAFVNIDGFDCLAHIGDISWTKISKADEVLKIGQSYDFLVLSTDREKRRVSLGYKQLQPHPFVAALEKYTVGKIVKGRVARIVPFGAFVELEKGIDGLVHVSEAANGFVKNINDVVKVGDEVEVMVLNTDAQTRKINLSIKACNANAALEGEQSQSDERDNAKDESKPKNKKQKAQHRDSDDVSQWQEEVSLNPLAELLKKYDTTDKE